MTKNIIYISYKRYDQLFLKNVILCAKIMSYVELSLS